MRTARILALSAISFQLSTQITLAQSSALAPPLGHFERFGHFGPHVRTVAGQPYSAVRTTNIVQTLTTGGTINRTTTAKEARDSSGRVYRETQIMGGSTPARTMYAIFDPVNHVTMSWRSDTKQVISAHLPDFGQRTHAALSSTTPIQRHGPAPTVEQLGAKTIDGVDATGIRSTVVFPAGTFGNNEPITVTHERWVSADLGITLSETDSDPRTGVRTTTVTNLERTEPDAALFQVPQGYTVIECTRGRGTDF